MTNQNPKQQISDVVLATAGYDHTIRFWEALSGSCLRTIQHPDSINQIAISPDKRILAAAGNPLMIFSPQIPIQFPPLRATQRMLRQLHFNQQVDGL